MIIDAPPDAAAGSTPFNHTYLFLYNSSVKALTYITAGGFFFLFTGFQEENKRSPPKAGTGPLRPPSLRLPKGDPPATYGPFQH